MRTGIEDYLKVVGSEGCVALCLMQIAEYAKAALFGQQVVPTAEIWEKIEYAISRGWIYMDYTDPKNANNMFVNDPVSFGSFLLPMTKWTYDKVVDVPANWTLEPKRGAHLKRTGPSVANTYEHVIECWKNAHFRLPEWDPLVNSLSVATGSITSYRVVKVRKV